MTEEIMLQFAAILILAIAAQWLASRLQIPAILLLLLTGFIAGPILGILRPDQLLGDLLFPFVSIAVGIILFEGGLSLQLSDLRQVGRIVRNLISFGALIAWGLSSLFAALILGFEPLLAMQLGAILVVTGPTVVIPLLRFVRPSGPSVSVLRWEGILIDPIGATLALLVFEFLHVEDRGHVLTSIASGIVLTVLAGGILGYIAGRLLEVALRRYWIPDHLQTAITLMIVVGVFVLSNFIQHESGLLATTVMGITLANQRSTPIRHLIEFKENLGVLLLSTLFILLSARLELSDFSSVGLESLVFLAALVLVVRPATVLFSTRGSSLQWRDRIFMMWMAPRGIVAASVASVFALRLADAGYHQAEQLVPITFIVIVGTCTLYGLTAPLLARRLNLSQAHPQGVLIVGAHPLAVSIAQTIHDLGQNVLLVDTNYENIRAARLAGLPVKHGNILAETTYEELDLQGIGYLLALTSNDEVNAWAAFHYIHVFGRANVYQLSPKIDARLRTEALPRDIHGRIAFASNADFRTLSERFQEGSTIKSTRLTTEFNYEDYKSLYGDRALPLFLWDSSRLTVFSPDTSAIPQAGQVLISLIASAPTRDESAPLAQIS